MRYDFSWGFSFSGGLHIRVECLWRLLVSERVVLTSEDHAHQFGLPAPVDCVGEIRRCVEGVPITRATVRARTVDMSLDFSEAATLEVIATSTGYEAWVLSGQGVLIVGQPGYE
ncbi:hypothetical protein FTUN_7389 [Frigoriglobus tundricola]|uniref:Uncharacterized protein n=1 Tax=Frigoriglobus tundricola TaxID=2774151 RepID=A0A6M5Z1Z8_9BACT|nr:hypothetical protein FTUN_7389 [Frigoriglobus tundricola]